MCGIYTGALPFGQMQKPLDEEKIVNKRYFFVAKQVVIMP
jgi:hypothetical protein